MGVVDAGGADGGPGTFSLQGVRAGGANRARTEPVLLEGRPRGYAAPVPRSSAVPAGDERRCADDALSVWRDRYRVADERRELRRSGEVGPGRTVQAGGLGRGPQLQLPVLQSERSGLIKASRHGAQTGLVPTGG